MICYLDAEMCKEFSQAIMFIPLEQDEHVLNIESKAVEKIQLSDELRC